MKHKVASAYGEHAWSKK